MSSMSEKRRSTLADVAAAAGVSKMTASRALRGAVDVSATNVEKVRNAARDIGYVGNHAASSLSGQRSALIGVVVPSIENIVFAEVFSGIAEGLDQSGIQPFFGVTDYSAERENEIVRKMLSWNPRGLIITGLDQPEDTKNLLRDSGLPVVQIMDLDGTPIDGCVGFSHRKAGEAMAQALIDAGRREFGCVACGLDRDIRAKKRIAGFEAQLRKNRLSLIGQKIGDGASSITKGRVLTEKILAEHPDLDCIYYSNDDLATGGAFHCIANDIDVGNVLMLAGFNGLDILTDIPVKVATSHTPRRQIGYTAVKMILDRDITPMTVTTFVPSIKFG